MFHLQPKLMDLKCFKLWTSRCKRISAKNFGTFGRWWFSRWLSWFWRSFRKELNTFLFGKKFEVPLVDVSKVGGMVKFFFLPSRRVSTCRAGWETRCETVSKMSSVSKGGENHHKKPCLKRQRIRVPMLVLGWLYVLPIFSLLTPWCISQNPCFWSWFQPFPILFC